jgi:MFS transporter, SP family, sugar:H+ symporter
MSDGNNLEVLKCEDSAREEFEDGIETQQARLLSDCGEQKKSNNISFGSTRDTDHHHIQHKDIHDGKLYFVVLLAAFSSLGGWFFGYDQGVTGGIVIMSSFKNDFCVGVYANASVCDLSAAALPPGYRQFLVLFTLMYNLGCFIGALFISSFVAEKFGRRAIIFTSAVLFIIGTSMVILPAGGSKTIMIFILIGRVVEGTGVGCASFSCPLYASEIAPTRLRGMLSGFMAMALVSGLFAANVANFFLRNHKWGWRLSNGIILIAPLIIIIGIFFCPETPRWLFKRKGRESAEKSLKRIRKIDDVVAELNAIADAVQKEGDQLSIKELFTKKKMLRRLAIGMGIHVFLQTSGISPIFAFGGIIFESVLGSGIVSLLILSGANMLSTIPALFLFDRVGRRKLLIFCGLGMVIGHLVTATVFATGCNVVKTVINNTIVNEEVNCGTNAGVLMLTSTVFYIVCFALSWGAICWIYAAEIYPLNVRASAMSLTTASHWFMCIIMSYILELIAPLGIHGVFYLFSGLCFLAVIFVYLFCPETKGVLLEDIEGVFDDFQAQDKSIVKVLRRSLL